MIEKCYERDKCCDCPAKEFCNALVKIDDMKNIFESRADVYERLGDQLLAAFNAGRSAGLQMAMGFLAEAVCNGAEKYRASQSPTVN